VAAEIAIIGKAKRDHPHLTMDDMPHRVIELSGSVLVPAWRKGLTRIRPRVRLTQIEVACGLAR
jgi:hypothetical protein